jgi:hypothetical protein
VRDDVKLHPAAFFSSSTCSTASHYPPFTQAVMTELSEDIRRHPRLRHARTQSDCIAPALAAPKLYELR